MQRKGGRKRRAGIDPNNIPSGGPITCRIASKIWEWRKGEGNKTKGEGKQEKGGGSGKNSQKEPLHKDWKICKVIEGRRAGRREVDTLNAGR